MVGGREVCSAKAHSRGIDSGERGRGFGRGGGGKTGRLICRRRKVEAPDALCAADPPALGAGAGWVRERRLAAIEQGEVGRSGPPGRQPIINRRTSWGRSCREDPDRRRQGDPGSGGTRRFPRSRGDLGRAHCRRPAAWGRAPPREDSRRRRVR